jgi:Flp pilus assembly protein TadG
MAPVTRRRARWSDESGAELIEFALSLPILLLVGFGIMDFGLLFRRYEVITNAAREGARVGILPGYAAADVTVRVNQYLTAAGLTGTPTVTITPSTINVGGACVGMTSVTVGYPQTYSLVGGIASYFGSSGFASGTLLATAEMRNELRATGC